MALITRIDQTTRSRRTLVLILLGAGLVMAGLAVAVVLNGRALLTSSSSAEFSSDAAEDPAVEKAENRDVLERLARKYKRHKHAWELSEALYLEKVYLYLGTFGMLEFRNNPGTFAGELPEHDLYLFDAFIEAAEALQDGLTTYLTYYAQKSDNDYAKWTQFKTEVDTQALIQFPGSGNRSRDAAIAVNTAEYKAVVATTNENLIKAGKQTGKDLMRKVAEWVDALNATRTGP